MNNIKLRELSFKESADCGIVLPSDKFVLVKLPHSTGAQFYMFNSHCFWFSLSDNL